MYNVNIIGQVIRNVNYRFMVFFRYVCDINRYFFVNILVVNTFFIGDYQRIIVNMFFQIQRRSDDFNIIFQFRIKKRYQRRVYIIRSFCIGDIFYINMQRFFNDFGIVREVIVQFNNYRFIGFFLWVKDARCVVIVYQRIGDIISDANDVIF